MTSTQQNIGIDESKNNSTRVLKPPGGGTSSLFAPTPEETDKPRMPSSAADTTTNVVYGAEGKTNGVNGKTDGNPVTGEGYDTQDTQTPAPPRARIPPGGYSSGLW